MAAVLYGILLGTVMFVLARFAPQPAGAIVFWSLIGMQLAAGARMCWRRTGLPFATAAMIDGALIAGGLVILALMGQPFPRLAPASWVLVACAAASGTLFLFIESRVSQEKWSAWARHMEHGSLWHMLTGRHIPDLRESR